MNKKCEACHGDGFYIAFRSSGDEEVECKKCGGTGVIGGARIYAAGTPPRPCPQPPQRLMGRAPKPIDDTPSNVHVVTGTESRVCADIAARQAKGIAKYGTTVEANQLALREWLQHAYEETLDKAIYLKRAIEEMEK